MNELQKLDSFRASLAIVETIEEIRMHEAGAEAYANLAKKEKRSIKAQNEIGRYRINVEEKKGEWLDKRFPSSHVSNQYLVGTNSEPSKMPTSKSESARSRKISSTQPELKAKIMDEIEAKGDIITPVKLITQIKASEQKQKHDNIIINNDAQITGKYDVIVIDPPWDVKKIERYVAPNQSKELDYPTMDAEQIANIKIPANDNCHIFLWTTQKFLPTSFEILKHWGVKYVLTMVWHKPGGFQPYNLPQYNAEFCLYGRIGTPIFKETKSFFTCYEWPRGAHSEKPQGFYDLINRVTDGNRIDMFNRRVIEGFETWGNESN